MSARIILGFWYICIVKLTEWKGRVLFLHFLVQSAPFLDIWILFGSWILWSLENHMTYNLYVLCCLWGNLKWNQQQNLVVAWYIHIKGFSAEARDVKIRAKWAFLLSGTKCGLEVDLDSLMFYNKLSKMSQNIATKFHGMAMYDAVCNNSSFQEVGHYTAYHLFKSTAIEIALTLRLLLSCCDVH